MKSLTAPELAQWLADASRTKPLIIDVREPWEYAICHLEPSELVPLQQLGPRIPALDPSQPTVFVCHHGGRSLKVAQYLSQIGFADVYNLTGGVDAWARQVDTAMPTY